LLLLWREIFQRRGNDVVHVELAPRHRTRATMNGLNLIFLPK
jgi:hypothetical protein